MKLMKFRQCCSISLIFNRFIFLRFHGKLSFVVTLCYYLYYSLAFGKCKKVCNILKINLVIEFSPWKTKITCFPVGFVLKKFEENQLRIMCDTAFLNLEN